jgi:serine/threonine-protein kinase
MADVFEAEDQTLGRRVAVKILHPQFANDEAFVRRFRKEAQSAASLNHPNIVSIYDVGEDDGTDFMVMELVEGRTLRDILRSEGPLLPRRAAEVAAEAAAALSVAHQAGVVHRDMKTGNLMLTPDGSTKLADFGIARALDDSEELTRTGAVIGTATYFSPEQAQGLPSDGRSDIYSLGVVLYELLCGQPPFSGESPVAVAYQHVSEFAAPPSDVNPHVAPELDAIVTKAMEKDPTDRYQTAGEFRADLLRYLRGETPAAIMEAPAAETRLMAPPPATVPPDETARHVAQAPTETRASPASFAAIVVALLVALAVGVFLITRILGGSTESAATVTVPQLEGMPFNEAIQALQELDLKVRQREQSSDTVPEGQIIATDPAAGAEREAGSFVTLILSTGPVRFPVPNLIDIPLEDAVTQIENNDFVLGDVEERFDDDTPEGFVIRQDPTAGSLATPETVIDLEVSLGSFALTVPNVTGQEKDLAILQLTQAGFETIEEVEEFDLEIPEGAVIRTDPAADRLVPRGDTITIYVSLGPEPFEVPDLVGRTVEQARRLATNLGMTFILEGDTVEVTLASGLEGLIAEQSPAPDIEAFPGDEMRVKIGVLIQVEIPSLFGLTVEEATAELEARGLVLEVVGTTITEDENLVDKVIEQDPAAGQRISDGSIIRVTVGEPPPATTTTTTTTEAPPDT